MQRTIFEIKKDEAYASGFVPLFEIAVIYVKALVDNICNLCTFVRCLTRFKLGLKEYAPIKNNSRRRGE